MLTRPSPPVPQAARRTAIGRIPVEVDDDLAEQLDHLARAYDQPLESLAIELLRRGLEHEARRQRAEDALARLTPRQREVARLAAGGRTNRQIARELWLSPETVKTHLRRALEQFDLHSKAELRLLLFPLDGHPQEAKRDPLRDARRDPLRDAPSGVPSPGCPLQGAKRDEPRRSATKRDPHPARG